MEEIQMMETPLKEEVGRPGYWLAAKEEELYCETEAVAEERRCLAPRCCGLALWEEGREGLR